MFIWIWNENFSVFSFPYFIIFHLDSEPSQDWKPRNPFWNEMSVCCTVLIASQWVLLKITFHFPCLSDTRLLNNLNIFGHLKPLHFCIYFCILLKNSEPLSSRIILYLWCVQWQSGEFMKTLSFIWEIMFIENLGTTLFQSNLWRFESFRCEAMHHLPLVIFKYINIYF